jgi:hypothetical protein
MNTSRKQTHDFLGKKEMSTRQMERVLVDLANALTHSDSIKRLLMKYPVLFETLANKPVEGWLLVSQVQDYLRLAWDASDLRRREWFIFQARRSYHWSTVIDPINSARLDSKLEEQVRLSRDLVEAQRAVPALTPFERCAYHFHRIAERARRCGNPECPAPYFFAMKKGQKYCSSKCSAPSQRDQKRRWWRENRAKMEGPSDL